MHEEAKADYFVKASITKGEKRLAGIPCKIFLPERIYGKPSMLLKPLKPADAQQLISLNGGEFFAEILDTNQKPDITIQAQVYCSQSGSPYWGPDLSDPYGQGYLQHLMIIERHSFHEMAGKTNITFWISSNKVLSPSISRSFSYTGDVEVKKYNCAEFQISNGLSLNFDTHFKEKAISSDEQLQWSYLVACAELKTPAASLEELQKDVLPFIDDFLLIASLASGKRTACLGWSAFDMHSLTKYYRGNFTFPEHSVEDSVHDGLPERQHSEEFIRTCYSSFASSNNQLALRSAICAAVPLSPHTLEASFLSLFAGLETLVLSFRRQHMLENILAKEDWKKLKKSLEKSIKDSAEPALSSDQRASIYNKLEELNRLSLKEAFEKFCQNNGIYLSDLWPVFGEKKTIGLVDIRNKLIHGDPFPIEMIHALSIANIHLRVALERSLVRVLGWDIAKTKVNPAYLQHYFRSAFSDFSVEQNTLFQYVRN